MDMSGTPPNWVKAREDCSIELAFEALRQIVKRDVEEANKLKRTREKKYEFKFHYENGGINRMFKVERVYFEAQIQAPDLPSVGFELQSDKKRIKVCSDKERYRLLPNFLLSQEWDETKQECKMFRSCDNPRNNKNQIKLWEASQEALSVLFFELP